VSVCLLLPSASKSSFKLIVAAGACSEALVDLPTREAFGVKLLSPSFSGESWSYVFIIDLAEGKLSNLVIRPCSSEPTVAIAAGNFSVVTPCNFDC